MISFIAAHWLAFALFAVGLAVATAFYVRWCIADWRKAVAEGDEIRARRQRESLPS